MLGMKACADQDCYVRPGESGVRPHRPNLGCYAAAHRNTARGIHRGIERNERMSAAFLVTYWILVTDGRRQDNCDCANNTSIDMKYTHN